jgi:hypothetical protein
MRLLYVHFHLFYLHANYLWHGTLSFGRLLHFAATDIAELDIS